MDAFKDKCIFWSGIMLKLLKYVLQNIYLYQGTFSNYVPRLQKPKYYFLGNVLRLSNWKNIVEFT